MALQVLQDSGSTRWKRLCRASSVVKEQKGWAGRSGEGRGRRKRRDTTLSRSALPKEGWRRAASGSVRIVVFSAFLLASEVDSFQFFFSSISQLLLGTASELGKERGGREEQHQTSASFPQCSHILHCVDRKWHQDSAQDLLLLSHVSPYFCYRNHRAWQPLTSFFAFNNLFLPSDL